MQITVCICGWIGTGVCIFKRCEKNSIIYPAGVKASAVGYRVVST